MTIKIFKYNLSDRDSIFLRINYRLTWKRLFFKECVIAHNLNEEMHRKCKETKDYYRNFILEIKVAEHLVYNNLN